LELHLAGKRALITGSSSGLGEGIARVLAAEGAAVVVHGDVTRDDEVTRVFEKATNFLGSIDILVNNAGVGFDVRGWDDLEPHEWTSMWETNVVSAVRFTRLALAGTRITVNAITPGAVMTPGFEKAVRALATQFGWGEDWDQIVHRVITELLPNPTGRLGTILDVGNLVAFLASPLAGYINGADVRIDGGSSSSFM